MARLNFEAFPRAEDANGVPASGAKMYVYEAGTTTPVTTFSDEDLTTAQAHPVVANVAGYFPQIYVPDGKYKILITTAADVTIDEADNVGQGIEEDLFNRKDLATLVADTTLAYGSGVKHVQAGDIIRTRAEGFSYEVAASDATDHHLTTAGGVKLKVLPGAGGVFDVRQFGCVCDGLTDDTAALQKAVSASLADRFLSTDNGSSGHGYRTLFFPGFCRVTETIVYPNNSIGISLLGNGETVSGILFDTTNDNLFEIGTYLTWSIRNMQLRAGSVSTGADGLPAVTGEAAGSRTNNLFKFTGDGSGSRFKQHECTMQGWGTVYDTTVASPNRDSTTISTCSFTSNDLIWDNTNVFAVIWTFENCKMHFNEICFRNPSRHLIIRGGDMINPGDFIQSDGTSSVGGSVLVEGVQFEMYQNIDNTKSPCLLNLTNSSGNHPQMIFRFCENISGSIYTKEVFKLQGVFSLILDTCNLRGICDVTAGSVVGRVASHLEFRGCTGTPSIALTRVSGVGDIPVNLVYDESVPSGHSVTTKVNRRFAGAMTDANNLTAAGVVHDYVKLGETINASSAGSEIPVFVPDGYDLTVAGAEMVFNHNTTGAFDIILWEDSTKATKIFEVTGVGTTGNLEVASVSANDILNVIKLDETSSNLYLEVTSTVNAGAITLDCGLKLVQAF